MRNPLDMVIVLNVIIFITQNIAFIKLFTNKTDKELRKYNKFIYSITLAYVLIMVALLWFSMGYVNLVLICLANNLLLLVYIAMKLKYKNKRSKKYAKMKPLKNTLLMMWITGNTLYVVFLVRTVI
ncbi:hypothetical protein COF68_06245 [Bacillus toyonensis]|nr:hypothetical protein COF68_06245 [Bacillus toyonensis]